MNCKVCGVEILEQDDDGGWTCRNTNCGAYHPPEPPERFFTALERSVKMKAIMEKGNGMTNAGTEIHHQEATE